MSLIRFSMMTLTASLCCAPLAMAQDLMIFPNDGQSADQQQQDEFQCYNWAKERTGFDPMAAPTATSPPPQQEAQKGGAGRGLVRGAAVGGIVGGSDGAKKGAAAGALMGGMRRRDQKRSQEQERANWEQQQAQQYQAARSEYNRAFAACLEGKGYTVR